MSDSESLSGETNQPQVVVEHPDRQQLRQFVTTIRNAEQQVGEHIIQALSSEGTVAVLTMVTGNQNGQQQIVSAAIGPEMMIQIRDLLSSAEKQRQVDEPCLGYHCLVRPKT
jgi:hypothetical protein